MNVKQYNKQQMNNKAVQHPAAGLGRGERARKQSSVFLYSHQGKRAAPDEIWGEAGQKGLGTGKEGIAPPLQLGEGRYSPGQYSHIHNTPLLKTEAQLSWPL